MKPQWVHDICDIWFFFVLTVLHVFTILLLHFRKFSCWFFPFNVMQCWIHFNVCLQCILWIHGLRFERFGFNEDSKFALLKSLFYDDVAISTVARSMHSKQNYKFISLYSRYRNMFLNIFGSGDIINKLYNGNPLLWNRNTHLM